MGSDPEVVCTQPTDEAGHSCIKCDGQFVVALASEGSVNIDYVVLQPGEWGRFQGLPVRKQTVDIMQRMVRRTMIAGNLGCILPRVPAIIVWTGHLGHPLRWLLRVCHSLARRRRRHSAFRPERRVLPVAEMDGAGVEAPLDRRGVERILRQQLLPHRRL